MPNWFVHSKWTKRLGIDPLIANYVDRNIDYGTEWAFSEKELTEKEIEEPISLKQLKFFYKKDLEKQYNADLLHVKAYYIHHFLDFLVETRLDLRDLDLIFTKFCETKVFLELEDEKFQKISFKKLFLKLREFFQNNMEELTNDLK